MAPEKKSCGCGCGGSKKGSSKWIVCLVVIGLVVAGLYYTFNK